MTAADTMAAKLLEGDLEDLVDNLPQKAVLPMETAYVELVKQLLATGEEKLTREELLTIFRYRVGDVPESPNKFTSFLRHHRIHIKGIWRDRTRQGIDVAWRQSREWMAEQLAALMEPTVVRGSVPIKRAKIVQ